jgi:DNA-binding transcriptional LysR family regulator
VSQPTLSAGIKDLERELGVELVRRGTRFAGLTTAGERVLSWAERIVTQCEALRDEVGASRMELGGTLTLGAIPSAAPAAALLIDAVAGRYPNVRATVLSCSAGDIARGLDEGRFNAGISYLDARSVGATETGIALYDERYVLVTPADGPIGTQATATWREASALPLCLFDPLMQHRQLINAAFAAAGVVPRSRIEVDSVLSVLSHVRFGGYSAILPKALLVLIHTWDDIRCVPLVDPVVTHPVGLVVPRRRPLPPITAAVADLAATLDVDRRLC